MKELLYLLLLLPHLLGAQINFNDYFHPKTLRVDFDLAGNAKTTNAFLFQLIEEPHWGGRQANLDTSLRLGDYLMLLQDAQNGHTIYEEGFATLFEEWQDTKEAQNISRSFPNSIVMPYPKKDAILSIIARKKGEFTDTLMLIPVSPNGKEIVKATPPPFTVDTILYNKAPQNAIDIVVIGEGFRTEEMDKFANESRALAKTLFSSKVFSKNNESINVYAVQSPSLESGADNPKKDEWINSYFDASFNTLYSERYLMVKDIRKVRDVASLVPYDQIYILVNTEKYGGGGIYNFYSICSAYGRANEQVLIHEFGHGFGALADEYYYDDDFLTDYIDQSREPWQKNITTLVDFDQKWADMLKKKTPVPTPAARAKKYPLGVFEGAAYVSKGVYRSSLDCRMKSNTAEDFCPVCERAIQEVIDFLTE